MNDPASNKPAEDGTTETQTEDMFDFSDPVEAAKAKVRASAEAAAAEGVEPEAPADPLSFLAQKLTEAEAERDELKDRMLRALADGENTRRRAMRDREEAEKYGGVRLARDLLAVYDNLERALQAADDTVRSTAPDFIEGVELTQRELLNAFAKHNIAPVRPELGTKFDPNQHQAMFESPAPGAENNTIIQVMQEGFTISDRLLRAAMVGVAKNPAGAAAPAKEADDAPAEDDTPSDPTTES